MITVQIQIDNMTFILKPVCIETRTITGLFRKKQETSVIYIPREIYTHISIRAKRAEVDRHKINGVYLTRDSSGQWAMITMIEEKCGENSIGHVKDVYGGSDATNDQTVKVYQIFFGGLFRRKI